MAVGTELVSRAVLRDMTDAILISGDRDFYPAIERARAAGVNVGLVSSRVAGSRSHTDLDLGLQYIEDIRPDIRRETVRCRNESHSGDPWVFLDSQEDWEYPHWCDRCLRSCSHAGNG
jgi:hypothetical protein